MSSNVVSYLVQEFTQEPNNVWVWRKRDEPAELVEVCVASLIGIVVKVEAHLHGVSLFGPWVALLDASHLSYDAILARTEKSLDLERLGTLAHG